MSISLEKTNEMSNVDLIAESLRAVAPTYPRRVGKHQRTVASIKEAAKLLRKAERDENDFPFISTYSFPRGHSSDGEIPRIDRLFIDFDVPDRESKWEIAMSRLLVRVRKIAGVILETNNAGAWQASLSGHKGVHLDVTFPPVSEANGDRGQFKAGLGDYASGIVAALAEVTGIDDLDEYVDISSADLARMRRVPNMIHSGATKRFGEPRFCVPVSLDELANITPADYIQLTKSRRRITDGMMPTPSRRAHDRVTVAVRTASTNSTRSVGESRYDTDVVEAYRRGSNGSVGVDDLAFMFTDRPCIQTFIERDDAFEHGSASHLMEMKVITEMANRNVPIETMVDYFSQHDDFDKAYTKQQIHQYIGRQYDPVACETIWDNADQFCIGSDCYLYDDE